MAEKFTRFELADQLTNEAEIAAYLEACLAEAGDDPAFIAFALGEVARARGLSQVARASGLTREGLYKALSAGGNPSLATIVKVLAALGLRLSVQPRAS